MNRYEIQADVEFVIFAKSESEAFELADNKIKSIVEKPMNPQSNYIAVGLYLFDFDCFEYIKSIEKSERGEYEITSLIEKYLHIGNLNYKFANGWWIDAGTPERIFELENKLS